MENAWIKHLKIAHLGTRKGKKKHLLFQNFWVDLEVMFIEGQYKKI
jgi:hypothetical protein